MLYTSIYLQVCYIGKHLNKTYFTVLQLLKIVISCFKKVLKFVQFHSDLVTFELTPLHALQNCL